MLDLVLQREEGYLLGYNTMQGLEQSIIALPINTSFLYVYLRTLKV